MRHAKLSLALAATLLGGTALAAAPPAAAPAPAPSAAPAGSHYRLDPAQSSLQFTFLQAGAANTGRFTRFMVSLDFPGADPAGGQLDVVVYTLLLDTGDKDRDATLKSDDLFAVARFPQAHFAAEQIVKSGNGYEAIGKLTIRGVTRDVRVPFTFRAAVEGGANVAYMTGKTLVRRLDYGVGQGEWKATDQAGNDVTVSFSLRLVPPAHPGSAPTNN
jgi:polyisoprenoid-binding protein YceI